jgi:2-phospho-L-lactate transferase/gluconeogenesis factor (CofD/UPF0052 family)
MTEPGETDDFAVSDHIRALDGAAGHYLFDAVLVQRKPPSPAVLNHYASQQAKPVVLDREAITRLRASNYCRQHYGGAGQFIGAPPSSKPG